MEASAKDLPTGFVGEQRLILNLAVCLQVCAKTIRVVGVIPKGLPGATVHWWKNIPNVGKKFGYAIVICLIDLLESISIAKALALKNRYEIM